MDKWRHSYLIELKILLEKEKLLITSNFAFSHNVFKSCLLLMRQNEYLWSKGLTAFLKKVGQYITFSLKKIVGRILVFTYQEQQFPLKMEHQSIESHSLSLCGQKHQHKMLPQPEKKKNRNETVKGKMSYIIWV